MARLDIQANNSGQILKYKLKKRVCLQILVQVLLRGNAKQTDYMRYSTNKLGYIQNKVDLKAPNALAPKFSKIRVNIIGKQERYISIRNDSSILYLQNYY